MGHFLHCTRFVLFYTIGLFCIRTLAFISKPLPTPTLFTVHPFKLHTSSLTFLCFSAMLSSTLQGCIFSSLTWPASAEHLYALTSTSCHHNRPAASGAESTICSSLFSSSASTIWHCIRWGVSEAGWKNV